MKIKDDTIRLWLKKTNVEEGPRELTDVVPRLLLVLFDCNDVSGVPDSDLLHEVRDRADALADSIAGLRWQVETMESSYYNPHKSIITLQECRFSRARGNRKILEHIGKTGLTPDGDEEKIGESTEAESLGAYLKPRMPLVFSVRGTETESRRARIEELRVGDPVQMEVVIHQSRYVVSYNLGEIEVFTAKHGSLGYLGHLKGSHSNAVLLQVGS